MRNVLTILATLCFKVGIYAQTPEKLSYQAVIRDGDNKLVSNQEVGMQISILQGSDNGTVVYSETQTTSTNANGLVSIHIVSGVTSNDFSSSDWSTSTYYIKTETDPSGGNNYTIIGVSPFLGVPYALHAKSAETITGDIVEADPIYTQSQAVNITATDIINLMNLSGNKTGDQDLSGILQNTQAIKDSAV